LREQAREWALRWRWWSLFLLPYAALVLGYEFVLRWSKRR
jgi:hypothetical protein